MPARCATSPSGSSTTGASGKPAWIASATTLLICRKAIPMPKIDDAVLPEHRELTLVRVYNAPRALVFKAFTDPVHLARWWGPHGFTTPVCEFDARPGGALCIHMRAPDGRIYIAQGEVREIVTPERLVF